MSQGPADFGPSLRMLDKADWIAEVSELVDDDGYLQRLGAHHHAVFTEHGPTLLVTFETLQDIQNLSPMAQPLGWGLVSARQWSSLSLIGDEETWFRDPAVYAYFDRLADDGFFDEFEKVIFYGEGSCGYAAAAFSVAAPGALVLSLQPQATLAPHLTGWDRRFTDQRRLDFTGRYGYAPDMLEGARQAFVLHDPTCREDAMHAALFNRPNVTQLRLPYTGFNVQTDLLQMGILFPLIEAVADDRLTPAVFGQMTRCRRSHLPYLNRLLAHIEQSGRTDLARRLCQYVTARRNAPRFARHLKSLTEESA